MPAPSRRRRCAKFRATRFERRLDDPSLLLVDVLPHEAYAVEHIRGAVNLPLAEVEQRAPELLPDRNADIAAYCGKFT